MTATSLEVQYGYPLVILSPLVAVSKWANECPFVLEEKIKKGNELTKTKLRMRQERI